MIAVDTNILVYAHRDETVKHRAAYGRIVSLAESRARWGLPVFCIGEFYRVITHARIFERPHTAAQACSAVRNILASPSVAVLSPGPDYAARLLETLQESGATGNMVCDAQIAALCLEHGASRLLTEDRDFGRFRGLEVIRL